MVRRIAILALPDCQPLDVIGPYEVFAGAHAALRASGASARGYEALVVAHGRAPLRSESGLSLTPQATLASVARASAKPLDTLIVAGGRGARARDHDPRLLKTLQLAAARARRVAAVCTGAFTLAAAGLLDGKRVTTHWNHCQELARRFPKLTVDPDPIYVRDGSTWTSAGVTAGMDLALAMVERDHGHALAALVSRHLVMFIRRAGGQSQFSPHLRVIEPEHTRLRELHAYISEHVDAPLDLPSLAKRAGMSLRNFSRRFRSETGATPAAYIERVRLDHARGLLEASELAIEDVAQRAGFGSAETLRRVFARRIGLSPREYRARFAAPARTAKGAHS
jgi:transcriptional regulator GlxA family with amidase domain